MGSLYPQYLLREELLGSKYWQQKKREGKQVATAESVDAGGRRSAHSKRSKEPKGKGVALPQEEENEDITEEDQAPHKRAKVSTGKKVDTESDITKTPTEDELYGHLKNGVLWPPTRFADIKIMEELEIGCSTRAHNALVRGLDEGWSHAGCSTRAHNAQVRGLDAG
ncbi:hypothetical protein F2Q69_00037703 [Brassica cretica]|uniref:Uncharacterized protein n=1 Tax=Brassica cretica TaxID=69181 RepID=A0A8S9S9S5_BRACR|nr:hypothetical protein F2Q69_00037703 [Brassica cretica]